MFDVNRDVDESDDSLWITLVWCQNESLHATDDIYIAAQLPIESAETRLDIYL